MKILHSIVSLNDSDGGPARSVPALANSLGNAGADVVVCSLSPATIDLSKFPSARFVSGSIAQWIKQEQPDLVHDHGIWLLSNHRATQAAAKSNIPFIISPRGMLEPWCMQHHSLRKKVAWHVYQQRDIQRSSAIHATSPAEVSSIRALNFRQPVLLVPNGVTPPVVRPATIPSGQKKRLVFVSRIHPVKGLNHLLEAWAEIRPPEWTLSLFGPSEDGHANCIRDLIQTLDLMDAVTLETALDENQKWQQLSLADAVVLPSFSENFGIVVAEALLMGTPVLTTTGTPWHGLLERNCGWWVEPNVKCMKQGLSDVFGCNRDTLDEMGNRGREWVEADFLWSGIGRQMLASYEWLCSREPTGSRPVNLLY